MSRKTGFLIVVVFILLLVGIFGWLFYTSPETIPFLTGKDKDSGGGRGFFPFGGKGGNDRTIDGTTPDGVTPPISPVSPDEPLPILRDISSVPVSGATVIEDLENEVSRIRYVERSTGHIFETTTLSKTTIRISNTTIPKTQRAIFAPDGNSLIMQYQNDEDDAIITYYGLISNQERGKEALETPLEGVFLPSDITGIVASGKTGGIFYLLKDIDGGIGGFTSNIDDTERKQIFDSPLYEWQALWPREDTIVLTTNASGATEGYSYTLHTKTKKLDPLIGKKRGLTVLPNHDATKILYSQYQKGEEVSLKIYNRKDRSENVLILHTLPEKCVWGVVNTEVIYCGVPKKMPTGMYPDDWYQGEAVFSDSIWSINAENGAVDLVADLENIASEKLDITSPFLNTTEDYLFFTDKNALHLWSLKIGI